MVRSLVIRSRFCGPAESGNGGYVCGLLSMLVGGTAEVTLWKPPPLERDLEIMESGKGIQLLDQGLLIAEGHPAQLNETPPVAISFSTAMEASRGYSGFQKHQFPTCFVCGPNRSEGDGLRIFAGLVTGSEIVAAPWVPGNDLGDSNGVVNEEFMYAAMDCPGYYAISGPEHPAMVLGKMTARVLNPIRTGQKVVVVGLKKWRQGRKAEAVTAIYSHTGQLCSYARSMWIELK